MHVIFYGDLVNYYYTYEKDLSKNCQFNFHRNNDSFSFCSYLLVCIAVHAKSLQSCPALCNLVDCSPPGFSVQGILQVRILEWVALSFSGRSAQPRDQTQGLNPGLPHGMWILYSLSHQGSPVSTYKHTSISTPIPPWQNKRELSRHKYPVRNHRDFGGGSHRMGAELFSASWLGLH